MTAALSPVARDLLAWLQERPAAGEGSLKAWGQGRRPSLTLTQVEVRAGELVEAGLATRELRPDGRAVYRARERAPEPPPVEVVTGLTTLHAWGQELLAHLRTVPEAKAADLAAWGLAHAPPLELHQVEGLVDELIKSKKVTVEVKRAGKRRDRVIYRAVPAQVVTEPGWIPRTDNAGPFFAIDRSPEPPTPCAECTRMAEALLSWERLWGVNGTDLAAMETRIQTAERERDEARAEAAKVAAALAHLATRAQTTPPAPPVASAVYGAQLALDALSTSRGTSRREVAGRAGISLASAGKALAALASEGLAYESTPGLWRKR